MRKICFVTGSRAEYGILRPVMRLVEESPEAMLQIVATNMHLSPEYGLTYKEIEADGFRIDEKVEMLLSSDTPTGTIKSAGLAMIGLADAFARLRPDLAVILGDRFEMLATASAALIAGIPIAHLHGGEITLGAYDDSVRHGITKMSSLHFTSTEEYRSRVIQMGENPAMVFTCGSPAAEAIASFRPMPLEQLEKETGFSTSGKFIVATFHPVTREPGEARRQTEALLGALDTLPADVSVIFTLPNSDAEGRAVSEMIQNWAASNPRAFAVASLGQLRYFSAVAHSLGVVGNSSSGLIEAPSLGVPTLDIGNRQAGRACGESVIHVEATQPAIEAGLRRLMSEEMQQTASRRINPYYRPGTAALVADRLIHTPAEALGAKSFFDIPLPESL